jgi:hypothetical protein
MYALRESVRQADNLSGAQTITNQTNAKETAHVCN